MIRKIYNTRENIEKYYESSEVSQSLLKKGLEDFKNYYTPINYKQTEAMLLGSIVDLLLTSEHPIDEFEKMYLIQNPDISTSGAVVEIMEALVMTTRDSYQELSEIPDEEIEEVIKSFNWQSNWLMPTKIKKIREQEDLYDSILDCYDEFGNKKQQVSLELYEKAKKMAHEAQKTLNTYLANLEDSLEDIVIFYQKDLYSIIQGVKCKSLLDIIIIGYNKTFKRIEIIPIDLKTVWGHNFITNFEISFKKHGYDFQSCFYTLQIVENTKKLIKEYVKITKKDYVKTQSHVVFFKFIIVNTEETPISVIVKTDGSLFSETTKKVNLALEEYTFYNKRQDDMDKRAVKFLEGGKELTISTEFEIV